MKDFNYTKPNQDECKILFEDDPSHPNKCIYSDGFFKCTLKSNSIQEQELISLITNSVSYPFSLEIDNSLLLPGIQSCQSIVKMAYQLETSVISTNKYENYRTLFPKIHKCYDDHFSMPLSPPLNDELIAITFPLLFPVISIMARMFLRRRKN